MDTLQISLAVTAATIVAAITFAKANSGPLHISDARHMVVASAPESAPQNARLSPRIRSEAQASWPRPGD